MSVATELVGPAKSAAPSRRRRNVHFVVAVVILLVATGWWQFAKNYLNMALRKEAVPWPEGMRVGDDFRLLSLPATIGPYTLTENGEEIIDASQLELLGIGTGSDEDRYADRSSNWYLSRVYRDTRAESPAAPYAQWRLHLTYYTGAMDTVPHIPDVCLQQGGNQLIATDVVSFRVPAARNPWDQEMKINRTQYSITRPDRPFPMPHSQYYVFSLNGKPEHEWKMVRLGLTNPWSRYCYFAKIQFAPLTPVEKPEEGDEKAKEFLDIVLPRVLEALPMPADIERLGAARQSRGS